MQPPGTERNIQRTRQARTIFGFVLLFVALLGFAFWNIAAGSTPMSLPEVFDGLLDPSSPHRVIVMDVRMVRIVPAILLGGALALSGFLLQTFFNNPIAGPFILGISSGARSRCSCARSRCRWW